MEQLLELDKKFEREFWKDIIYEIVSTMDPWDIDIEELIKRYSEKINTMKNLNLKIPADVILVCAVLLRMKAEILKFSDEKNEVEDNEIYEEIYEEEDEIYDINKDSLNPNDKDVDIKLIPKRIIKGKISVDELIKAIQDVLKTTDKKILKKIEEKQIEIMEFKVDESIRDIIDKIYKKIIEIQKLSKEKKVKFSDVLDQKNKKKFVREFLAVLFLVNDRKIDIIQNENFGEIYLIPIC